MSSNDQNLINPDAYQFKKTPLNAAIIGSTADFVSRWLPVGVGVIDYGNVPLAEWILETESAAQGSAFEILRRGLYQVTVNIGAAADASVRVGILLDSTQAERETTWATGSTQVRGYTLGLSGAANAPSLFCSALVPIRQAIADAPGLGVVRVHLSTTAGAVVDPADIVAADSVLTITRVADCLA